MTCKNCHHHLPAHKSGFVVCANCGHVNHISDHHAYHHTHAHQTKKHHIHRRIHHKVQPYWITFLENRFSISVIVLAVALLIIMSYNHHLLLFGRSTSTIEYKPQVGPTISYPDQIKSSPQVPATNNTAKKTAPPPVVNTNQQEANNGFVAPPALPKVCYEIQSPANRSTDDQADDSNEYQVHIIYAIPKDGTDNQYDTNGTIARSVSAWQNWLCNQTGGRVIKLDTKGGALDVSFVKFDATDSVIERGDQLPWATDPNRNPYVREDIQIRLKKLGFNEPRKLYAVYYDGSSNYSCGGGAWPPGLPGHVAAEYMHGGDPKYPPCDGNKLASSITNPGYLDFDILHEIVHTLGYAPTCAPHLAQTSHVGDSPTDLMYSGSEPWSPSVLDFNHDDYYGANVAGCSDLSNSVFLTGSGTNLPASW